MPPQLEDSAIAGRAQVGGRESEPAGDDIATSRRHARIQIVFLTTIALLVAACGLVWLVNSGQGRSYQTILAEVDRAQATSADAQGAIQVAAFCGDCHALPRAESYPREAWHELALRGYEFYARSGRTDLDPPPPAVSIDYFRSRAPEQLTFPPAEQQSDSLLRTTFLAQRVPGSSLAPAIAHLRWAPLLSGQSPEVIACDMRGGQVTAVALAGPAPSRRELARLDNPCHAESCDLNGDGVLDLVVADLGSFTPDDHHRGRVVWLRGRSGLDGFDTIVLAGGLGRVADVRPTDVDADGDLDLLVAVFGLHRTGQILLLRNVTLAGEPPRFESERIDPRPGTIHIPVHDLNDDGLPDFVALISQEYESVEAFINLGDGHFQPHVLWSGPDLTFGSSGIELVDLDQDGDVDVVYTNGDSFDNSYANPSHGVQWLENQGEFKFAYHRLTDMTGAFRAIPGDVDMDGDLDLIVAAQLPEEIKPVSLATRPLAAVVILEQVGPGSFTRHTLESGGPRYAAAEAADFDGDGDLDFALGTVGGHWLTVWSNQLISQ